jgi:hypothetical protein
MRKTSNNDSWQKRGKIDKNWNEHAVTCKYLQINMFLSAMLTRE